MATDPPDIPTQRAQLTKALAELSVYIRAGLPEAVPEGTVDGPIMQHFTDVDFDDDWPYEAVDRAWVRVFQTSNFQPLLTRGPYGLMCVHDFMKSAAERPNMEKNNSLFLMAEKVRGLNGILAQIINACRGFGFSASIQAQGSQPDIPPNTIVGRPSAPGAAAEPSTKNKTGHPTQNAFEILGKRKQPPDSNSLDSDPRLAAAVNRALQIGNNKPPATKKPKTTSDKPKTRKKGKGKAKDADNIAVTDSDEDVPSSVPASAAALVADATADSSEVVIASQRRGKPSHRGDWALEQFTEHQSKDKSGKLVWLFRCKWCGVQRTLSGRSPSCKTMREQVPPLPRSNLISHLDKNKPSHCQKLPATSTFEAFEQSRLQQGLHGEAPPSDVVATGAHERQRGLLKDFVERGIINPAKEVTQRGFREYFVKGIVEDDLPFMFGEKQGMNRCFTYVLPRGYKIPDGSMVQRDGERLFAAIEEKVISELKALTSRPSAGSDFWTSKNCVFAFGAMLGYWIDETWVYNERPLTLQALDGDHSGRAAGKLLYEALKHYGIADKLLASTGDNASVNGVASAYLSKRISKRRSGQSKRTAADVQVGCAAHVTNLVVQAFLSGLGAAPNPDHHDLHEEIKGEDLVYDPEKDPAVLEEAALAAEELHLHRTGKLPTAEEEPEQDSDSDSSASDSEDESDTDNDRDGGADEEGGKTGQQKRSTGKVTRKKQSSVVHKLHTVAVEVLRSEKKRKKMRRLVRKYCAADVHHLVLIRSMPIRWNTVYAEIARGIQLREAVNHFVKGLADGLTGKKFAVAVTKEAQLTISGTDWELLVIIKDILEPFTQVTLSLSLKGVPTICMVLPLYKTMDKHIKTMKLAHQKHAAVYSGLMLAEAKLHVHLEKALKNKMVLLGAVLHPSIRVAYFEDTLLWDPSVSVRARALLQEAYDEYASKIAASLSTGAPSQASLGASAQPPKRSIFGAAIRTSSTSTGPAIEGEVPLYLKPGTFPCEDEYGALVWWKTYSAHFVVLKCVARDVLAIPGVSVSVERLFSQCKLTLSDQRSSMSAETASRTILAKEWLKRGLGDDVEYLDGVSIWRT